MSGVRLSALLALSATLIATCLGTAAARAWRAGRAAALGAVRVVPVADRVSRDRARPGAADLLQPGRPQRQLSPAWSPRMSS